MPLSREGRLLGPEHLPKLLWSCYSLVCDQPDILPIVRMMRIALGELYSAAAQVAYCVFDIHSRVDV